MVLCSMIKMMMMMRMVMVRRFPIWIENKSQNCDQQPFEFFESGRKQKSKNFRTEKLHLLPVLAWLAVCTRPSNLAALCRGRLLIPAAKRHETCQDTHHLQLTRKIHAPRQSQL